MKTLALIARKPGLASAEFRAHYEQRHVALALPLMRGLVCYVRHYVEATLHGQASFEVATSFDYRDAPAFADVRQRLASAAGDAVRADELAFMDKPRNRYFELRPLEERGARRAEAPFACIALVRRAAGWGRAEFSASFAAQALPALRDAVRGLRWQLHHEALPTFGEPEYDAVTQLHADADAGLARWGTEREHEGARVVLVRVAEHATPLPLGGPT